MVVCEKHKAARKRRADEGVNQRDLKKELELGKYKQGFWHLLLVPHNL